MTTLAEINKTLQQQVELMVQQGESIESTSKDISGIKDKIAQTLLQQRSDRLQEIEDKREGIKKTQISEGRPTSFMSGLSRGIGFDWLTGFLGALFSPVGALGGLLGGALGLAFAKIIKWGSIAGIIAYFFGEEINTFIKDLTGIDLAQLIIDNPGIAAGIAAAVSLIADWLVKTLLKVIGAALAGIGRGLGILPPKAQPPGTQPKPQPPETQPKAQPGEKPKSNQPRDEKGRYKPKTKAPSKVPGGSVVARGLAKVITRFLGPIGIALAAYDLINLIDATLGLSEARQNMTPEELEEERKKSGLAPGEIATNENQSVAPNRREAFEQEEQRRAAAEKTAARVDVLRGDNPYANTSLSGIDPIALQGRINAFQAYGVDRDRQRTIPGERGIARTPPSTGVGLGQMAANARMSVMINNAPQITNITNNNGGGGNTSVMTVPVGTADVSDRRDTIRRYGR